MTTLTKQQRQLESQERQNLSLAQKAEINALQRNLANSGYTQSQIDSILASERSANTAELASLKSLLGQEGYQTQFGLNNRGSLNTPLSLLSTSVPEDVRSAVSSDLSKAASLYTQYNLPLYYGTKDANSGYSLEKLLNVTYGRDPVTGAFNEKDKDFIRLASLSGNALTQQELSQTLNKDLNLRPVKNQAGVFQGKIGNQTLYFTQDNQGRYVNTGANRTYVKPVEESGNFFTSDLGRALLTIGTAYFAPGLGTFLMPSLSGAAAGALGGSLLGGASAALTGGNVLQGALLGGAGGAASGYFATPTGGETGAFDISGMGTGIDAAAGGPSMYGATTGAFDLSGAGTGIDASMGLPQYGPAPVYEATPVPPEQLYPGTEMGGFTPAPRSLQATLPEMGVQTASAAPYTQVPGSVGAVVSAAPAGGAATASTLGAKELFRAGNIAKNLMAQPQQRQPQMPQIAQQAPAMGGVDYNALLDLLTSRAGTAGLLGTRFSPESPNLLSLLG